MNMTKSKEKKIRQQIKKYLESKQLYELTDEILINQLIDWLKIEDDAKSRLKVDSTNWSTLSAIAMSSKNIQNLFVKLNMTPADRAKAIGKIETDDKDEALKHLFERLKN